MPQSKGDLGGTGAGRGDQVPPRQRNPDKKTAHHLSAHTDSATLGKLLNLSEPWVFSLVTERCQKYIYHRVGHMA